MGDTKILPGKFSTAYQSTIAFGKARIVTSDDEKISALTGLIKKYSAAYQEKGDNYIVAEKDRTTVIKIDIEHMTGKERNE